MYYYQRLFYNRKSLALSLRGCHKQYTPYSSNIHITIYTYRGRLYSASIEHIFSGAMPIAIYTCLSIRIARDGICICDALAIENWRREKISDLCECVSASGMSTHSIYTCTEHIVLVLMPWWSYCRRRGKHKNGEIHTHNAHSLKQRDRNIAFFSSGF